MSDFNDKHFLKRQQVGSSSVNQRRKVLHQFKKKLLNKQDEATWVLYLQLI